MILHSMNCFYEEAHNQSKGLCMKTQYLLSTVPKRFLQYATYVKLPPSVLDSPLHELFLWRGTQPIQREYKIIVQVSSEIVPAKF
ncbi:uncharacterized protein LOC113092934 isoform X3 [Carassius auratus]|uniref:Uncharacterized protein LOC113092934 isoform X3 n=1 Tax=Carassius auratus TaxID=7957 RepID=A0A6P6P0V4_CARAU|nr:uncharacterized protein LOC113092934 isoform X3 [Carassius auratus]